MSKRAYKKQKELGWTNMPYYMWALTANYYKRFYNKPKIKEDKNGD